MPGYLRRLALVLGCLFFLDAVVFGAPAVAEAVRETTRGQDYLLVVEQIPGERLYVQIAEPEKRNILVGPHKTWTEPSFRRWAFIDWKSEARPDQIRVLIRDGAGVQRYCGKLTDADNEDRYYKGTMHHYFLWLGFISLKKSTC